MCTVFTYDTIVIGTGAAGYNAACRLKQFDTKSVAMVTENINFGTSRNTGSDKQTYYKLGLGGDAPDSVGQMAQNLFSGGCVDGDNALCEAALSVRCFMNLCELGVPFPVNRYGEYVGYKTDHDPYARATSAGPLTSKFMTEALEKKASSLGVEIFDGYLAVEILTQDNQVCGLICLQKSSGQLVIFRCAQIILATGGPGGIYADSVYPSCHTGTTSLALCAGAKAQNLTEWQFGLASVDPRWNVSGTYMQVLPRFVSVDEDGTEHEFLGDFFKDPYEALSAVFLKGYQWPFDSRKVLSGSSVIDLLVYQECVDKKRKVYLDYTQNPFGLETICYDKLSSEAYTYLDKAGATFGTPIQRLLHMNAPAVELYADKGRDITKEYLQIALCAQHNNGGIAVDLWWQTSVEGLFAAGECAGTHGVARPGGSALNAGQVGSLRAAQYICEKGRKTSDLPPADTTFTAALARHQAIADAILSNPDNIEANLLLAKRRMSDNAAAIRDVKAMSEALEQINIQLTTLEQTVGVANAASFYQYYKLKDILITQAAVISAMINYTRMVGYTRGSALYTDPDGQLREGLNEVFRFTIQPEKPSVLSDAALTCDCSNVCDAFDFSGILASSFVQEICLTANGFTTNWRPVRPLPNKEDFFETVWRSYRENKNIY